MGASYAARVPITIPWNCASIRVQVRNVDVETSKDRRRIEPVTSRT
jgi:hypothetical protein